MSAQNASLVLILREDRSRLADLLAAMDRHLSGGVQDVEISRQHRWHHRRWLSRCIHALRTDGNAMGAHRANAGATEIAEAAGRLLVKLDQHYARFDLDDPTMDRVEAVKSGQALLHQLGKLVSAIDRYLGEHDTRLQHLLERRLPLAPKGEATYLT